MLIFDMYVLCRQTLTPWNYSLKKRYVTVIMYDDMERLGYYV